MRPRGGGLRPLQTLAMVAIGVLAVVVAFGVLHFIVGVIAILVKLVVVLAVIAAVAWLLLGRRR